MKIEDLTGLAKPLTRLIEVVSQGVGTLTKSYFTRKDADAEAYKIEAIATAIAEASDKRGVPVAYKDGAIEAWKKPEDGAFKLEVTTIQERVHSRVEYQERRHQENIERITYAAADKLADETEVPESGPTDDWVARFFRYAEDISSSEMQDLWGRILAGEIKRPGAFSLRALDAIRNLSAQDAALFETFARNALHCLDKKLPTAIIAAFDRAALERDGLTEIDLFHLSELDLMYPNQLTLKFEEPNTEIAFELADQVLIVERARARGPIPLQIWKFTSIGTELLPLIDRPRNEARLSSLGAYYLGRNCTVKLAEITGRTATGLAYDKRSVRELKLAT